MFGKFFVRFLVGLFAATIVTGGQALQIAAMAVICTAGVGLIVVLPAGYLIGLLITIWFIPFGKGPWSYAAKKALEAEKNYSEGKEPPLSGVVQYILRATERGAIAGNIRRDLLRNGWTEAQIDSAFETAKAIQSSR